MAGSVSEIFDAEAWDEVPGFELNDITYHRAKDSGTCLLYTSPSPRDS